MGSVAYLGFCEGFGVCESGFWNPADSPCPMGKRQLEICQANKGHTERCSRGLIVVAAVAGYLMAAR